MKTLKTFGLAGGLGQLGPLDGQGGLVGKGLHQPPLFRG